MRYSTKNCIGCDASFTAFTYRKQKFCSHKCYLSSRKGVPFSEEHRRRIGEANAGPKVIRSCKNCSKGFSVPVHVVNRKDKKQGIFCSRQCKNKYLSSARRGENHHNWKGGVLPIHTYIRHSTEYKIWRMEVFKRDDFTCVNCQERGCVLNADHIKPFSRILEENNLTTFEIALSCQELWDVNNGRTLCEPCHLAIGWRSFRKSNSQQNITYSLR